MWHCWDAMIENASLLQQLSSPGQLGIEHWRGFPNNFSGCDTVSIG